MRCELVVHAENMVLVLKVTADFFHDFGKFVIGELIGLFVFWEKLEVEDVAGLISADVDFDPIFHLSVPPSEILIL